MCFFNGFSVPHGVIGSQIRSMQLLRKHTDHILLQMEFWQIGVSSMLQHFLEKYLRFVYTFIKHVAIDDWIQIELYLNNLKILLR